MYGGKPHVLDAMHILKELREPDKLEPIGGQSERNTAEIDAAELSNLE